MPNARDTEILQVIPSQVRQDLVIYFVIAKRSLVLPETDTSKPIPNIHVTAADTKDFDLRTRTVLCPEPSRCQSYAAPNPFWTDGEELTLSIVLCGRHGRYNGTRLVEQNRDAKLTDLLQTLAACLIQDDFNACGVSAEMGKS